MTEVLLAHGAWGDASVWHPVMARLAELGHDPWALGLPMVSLAGDVAWTRRALGERDGPVILVGHSYAGMVVSAAAVGRSRVAGLVFVSAYVPEPTETVVELSGRGAQMPGRAAIRFAGDGWTTLDPDGFVDALAAGLPVATARVLAAAQRPTHQDCLTSAPGPVAWPDLPCAYVRTLDDRMFDPLLQRSFAARAHADVVELPASHLAPLSHPHAVASAISALAGA